MSSALRERLKRRRQVDISFGDALSEARATVRSEMLAMILAYMDVYAAEFKRLEKRYGQNLSFRTAPESAAEALFHFGLEAGVLTEHNRPAFVRTWRREPS